MVRTCTKKRNKPDVLEEVIQEAVRAVQESRLSLRDAASRLFHRVKTIISDDECSRPNVYTSGYTSQQVFSENQELISVDYIIKWSKLKYGMTCKQIRQLAYDFGRRVEYNFPLIGMTIRLQELTGYRALWKDIRALRFDSPKIQVYSEPLHSIKQT
jgi:hypothetical protein